MASYWIRGDNIRKIVILDSSAILMFFEFSLAWEKELDRLLGAYSIVVPAAVLYELENLRECKEGMQKQRVCAALKLIEKYEKIIVDTMAADEAVLKIAQHTENSVVLTNDTELRKRLTACKIPVIFLRGRKKLAMT
ncbi:MAG: hypothetical protein QXL17_04195 [Candidatus Thermoplasmatota archaeon]